MDGNAHRAAIEDLISQWGRPITISVKVEAGAKRVRIAEILFSKATFLDLVAYVWRGGMPGWENAIRPDYVVAMKNAINTSEFQLFSNFTL